MRDLFSIRDDLNRTTVEFLMTDLNTGLMLARVATGAKEHSPRQTRNIRNARLAYETVLRFRRKIEATSAVKDALDEKLGELRSMLETLGESFA